MTELIRTLDGKTVVSDEYLLFSFISLRCLVAEIVSKVKIELNISSNLVLQFY